MQNRLCAARAAQESRGKTCTNWSTVPSTGAGGPLPNTRLVRSVQYEGEGRYSAVVNDAFPLCNGECTAIKAPTYANATMTCPLVVEEIVRPFARSLKRSTQTENRHS